MPLNTDSSRKGSQYQHYIPQFILRRFRIAKYTPQQRNTLTRSRSQSESQKKRIFLYDMSARSLKACLISQVFGEQNLYRDVKDANPNHIEQAFSRLESKASLIVDHIHGAMVSPSKIFEITRKDLRVLRKFLFMQSYRTSHLAISYQMGSHEPLRDWIAQAKLHKGLKDDVEAWKYYINYLLETPHEVLVQKGEETLKRLGQETVDVMRRTVVDPKVNWLDVKYATFAKDYYMCICEASPDSEFILGDNSFGQGEGFINNGDRLHMVYVLSPRIAVILRLLIFDDPLPSITGVLAGIRMKHCSVKLAGFDPGFYAEDIVDQKFEEYRVSPAASNDVYNFKVVKLTLDETHAVNDVVLYNLSKQGSLTFASRTYMIDTLKAYRVSHDVDSRRFDKLLATLKEMCQKVQTPVPPAPVFCTTGSHTSVAEKTFESVLQTAMTPLGLPDCYSSAAKLYHAAIDPTVLHPVAKMIAKLTSESIIEFGSTLPPACLLVLQEYKRTSRKISDIPKPAFDYFINFVGYSLRYLAVLMGSTTVFQVVIRGAAVGLIEWLVQHRPDVLKGFGLVR